VIPFLTNDLPILIDPASHSLSTERLPEDWNTAYVSTLFRKGERQKARSYRPVSLTSIIGKILESIINEEIANHLGKLNIIKPSQHGFIKCKSCFPNLLEFFEDFTGRIDRSEPEDIVYRLFTLITWRKEWNVRFPNLPMNIGRRAGCNEDIVNLQWNLDRLSDRAKTWQMEFNVSVRSCILVGGIKRQIVI